jgi:hypothetical protein
LAPLLHLFYHCLHQFYELSTARAEKRAREVGKTAMGCRAFVVVGTWRIDVARFHRHLFGRAAGKPGARSSITKDGITLLKIPFELPDSCTTSGRSPWQGSIRHFIFPHSDRFRFKGKDH